MLSHYWKISDKTNLNTNVAYQVGHIGNSRIDYQLANSPDPTYYKLLPSYYLNSQDNYVPVFDSNGVIIQYTNPNAETAATNFINDGQIDWPAMYFANTASVNAGKSLYALYEDRTDDKLWSANSYINSRVSDNISLNAGINFRKLKSENYQKLTDLLGGSFFLDVDPFYYDDATQSDLNHPDRQVVVGDSYGYKYNLLATTFDGFTQFKFNYKKVDFYLGQSFSRSEFQRDGKYRNGIYASNSYGKSDKAIYENFGFKGGLTYKMNGHNFLDFNGVYMTKAPSLKNVFSNSRLNNNLTPGVTSESVISADASYIIKAPKFKARITGFYSKIINASEVSLEF